MYHTIFGGLGLNEIIISRKTQTHTRTAHAASTHLFFNTFACAIHFPFLAFRFAHYSCCFRHRRRRRRFRSRMEIHSLFAVDLTRTAIAKENKNFARSHSYTVMFMRFDKYIFLKTSLLLRITHNLVWNVRQFSSFKTI